MLRTTDDGTRRASLALQGADQLPDRICLGVDLLSIEARGDLLAVLRHLLLKRFLGYGEHAASTACAVGKQVSA